MSWVAAAAQIGISKVAAVRRVAAAPIGISKVAAQKVVDRQADASSVKVRLPHLHHPEGCGKFAQCHPGSIQPPSLRQS